MSGSTSRICGATTRAIHGRQKPDPSTGAVIPPIYATSTFAQASPGVHKGWEYSRSENPTRAAFEAGLAEAEGGDAGFAFASGLAAEAAVLDLLEYGSHIVVSEDVYGGSWRLFHQVRSHSANLSVTHVDTADIKAVERAITPRTAMIWIETPSNPLLRLGDLEAIAAIGRRHRIFTVVDNTFASPAVQQPLAHGVDIVLHSVTKYIGGHSDIIGGGVVVRDSPDLVARLKFLHNATGAVLDPFSSFLALRGLKTLHLRMERHAANASRIAEWLEGNSKIERVIYPGRPSHPQFAVAKRQMKSGGGMISVFLKGSESEITSALSRFQIFTLAESLGGIESLVCQPSTMSHGSVPRERRAALGITPNLVRLSVGIEDVDDLISDLASALEAL